MLWCDRCGAVEEAEYPEGTLRGVDWETFFESGKTEQAVFLACPRCGGSMWMVNPGDAVLVETET